MALAARRRMSNFGAPCGAVNRSMAKSEGRKRRTLLRTADSASAIWPSTMNVRAALQGGDDHVYARCGLVERGAVGDVADDHHCPLAMRESTA